MFAAAVILGISVPVILINVSNTSETPETIILNDTTIFIEAQYPQVPSEVPCLRIISRNVSEEYALEIADHIFNVSGEVRRFVYPEHRHVSWKISSGSRWVVIIANGSLNYGDDSTREMGIETLSEAKAIEVGKVFVQKLRSEGLTPESLRVDFENVECEISKGYSDGDETLLGFWVNFPVFYNDFPLSGLEKISILVGGGGKVFHCETFWWEVESYDEVKIITPRESLDGFKEEINTSPFFAGPFIRIYVKSIELGYYVPFDIPSIAVVETILPYYFFYCEGIRSDGFTTEFMVPVTAVAT